MHTTVGGLERRRGGGTLKDVELVVEEETEATCSCCAMHKSVEGNQIKMGSRSFEGQHANLQKCNLRDLQAFEAIQLGI